MKKILIVFVALSFAFAGCKNENVANPQITLGKATITGTLRAELDPNTAGKEKVVGKTVTARVSTKDLVSNPNNNVTYGYKYYTTTTDANGKYTFDNIEVRSDISSMDVVLTPQDFEQTIGTATTPTQFFGAGAQDDVMVYSGGTFLLDLAY